MSQPKTPPPSVLLIMWGAFLVSHGLFLFVGEFIRPPAAEHPESAEMMAMVLTGVGLMTALGSALAVPLIAPKANYFTAMILRFAIAESVSIYGLVLATLGAPKMWCYLLAALGVLAHVVAYPSERERQRFERDQA